MINTVELKTNFDFVFCIDRTARCYFYAINEDLADHILTLRERLEAMAMNEVGRIRVRFVLFSDYGTEVEPVIETEFFDLDSDGDAIRAALNYNSGGGGDIPEDALEGLYFAMNSDFETVKGERNRHVIVLYTDSPAHPPRTNDAAPGYPEGMPASLAELREMWESLPNRRYLRLFLLAPELEPWSKIADWANVYHTSEQSNFGEMTGEDLIGIITDPALAGVLGLCAI